METEESEIIVKLSDICRTCLIKSDNMTPLILGDADNLDIISKLSSISYLEIQINENFPNYLCNDCEEKLNIAFDFQQLAQKSHQVILECIGTNVPIELDLHPQNSGLFVPSDNDTEQQDEKSQETYLQLTFNNDYVEEHEDDNLEEPTNSIKSVECEEQIEPKPQEMDKKSGTNQTMRLAQYSSEDVNKAIKKVKERFSAKSECILCGFCATNKRALSVHMSRLHSELKTTWCSYCNSTFDNLEQHKESMHLEKDFKCQFCGKLFTTTSSFLEHLYSHTTDRPYKCNVCSKCFISTRHLNVHLQRAHASKHSCSYCEKTFNRLASLKKHLKIHQNLKCKICEAGFMKQEQYDEHVCFKQNGNEVVIPEDVDEKEDEEAKTEITPQNFCIECNRKVRSLAMHMKTVHNPSKELKVQRPFLCTYCGKQFRTGSKLKVHIRIHTGETPYKCSFCTRRMSTRNQLVLHERTHTGEKPHVCNICGKAFAQSSVLNTHMKLHTGRPEQCNVCLKRFCRPTELRLHMRQHTGEKPYHCNECGQTFKQKSHLGEHLKTHSDERPFKCQYCGKGFKQNSSLKSHSQIHLGEKPFKCSQCPYACRQSYSLTQHMHHHEKDAPQVDRPHECYICHKSFTTTAMLNSHYTTSHNYVYSQQ